MDWISVAWLMMAGACFTLGLMHLAIWLRQREQYSLLAFSIATLAICVFAFIELGIMRAASVADAVSWLRWAHAPIFVVMVALTAFVQLYFGTGRLWLAWIVIALRALLLVADQLSDVNANYLQVLSLGSLELWGARASVVAEGVINPWSRLAPLSLVIFLVYLLDATLSLWRRGAATARERAVVIGVGIALTIVFAGTIATLKHEGLLVWPYVVTPAFLSILVAIGYELGKDVSRARELAQQVQASDARLRLSASATGVGIWEWNAARGELWISDMCRTLLGFPPSVTVTPQSFLDKLSTYDGAGVHWTFDRLIAQAGKVDLELCLPPAGKGERWVVVRSAVDASSSGRPELLRGAAFDITERKQAELELALRRDELTHLSRVGMLGELSGSLAHELNQPLAAILSNAQATQRMLAKGTVAANELEGILQDIVDDTKRAGEVIRRLRSLLRRGEVEREPVDLNAIVLEVLRLMRSDFTVRGVLVDTELAPALPSVLGDRVQLQQVLLNLILNGCEAMESTAAPHRLTVRSQLDGESAVRVTIIDRGTGIPADQLGRIFDPFVTTKSQGLGLGLSVCRTIVEFHGGAIGAENNAAGGAVLYFRLPRIGATIA